MAERVKQRMAVVSRNPDFLHFFEWEAETCDCPIQICSVPPSDCSAYDWIIMDAEAGYCVSDNPFCRVVTVVRETDGRSVSHADLVWEWPIPVGRVRALFESEARGKDSVSDQTEEKEHLTPKIYILSSQTHTLLYRNRSITLSEGEWKLFRHLSQHNGQAVTREALQALFGGSGNIVEVYIHALRKKLEDPFGVRVIDTVRGKGYRLRAETQWWNIT